jgi:hypothetical protein
MLQATQASMRSFNEHPMDVVVGDIARTDEDTSPTLSAPVSVGGEGYVIRYRCSRGPIADGAESLLIALLLPAMKHGLTIHSASPVSSRLMQSIPAIQDTFKMWNPEFQKVALDVSVRESPLPSVAKGVGAFFSGGVDSFYTLLKNHDEITALIFVQGIEKHLADNSLLRSKVTSSIREAAAKLGKALIEVETNLRPFSDRYTSWGEVYHGAGLASVALLLSQQFRKVYIPSSHTYPQPFPWGSDPLLDPMWSTEATEIVHDGSEAARVEKVRFIASNNVVREHLRVCLNRNGNGKYNCGTCGKCMRTMISLHIAGALEHCRTFPEPLRIGAVARIHIPDVRTRSYTEEILSAAERWGGDHRLSRALRDSLRGRYYRGVWRLANAARHRFYRVWRAVRVRWSAKRN